MQHIRVKERCSTAGATTVPIFAGVVAQHDVPIYLTASVRFIAYNTVVVRSQIQGQIRQHQFSPRAGPCIPATYRRSTRVPTGFQIDQFTLQNLPARSGPAPECRANSLATTPLLSRA